MKIIRPLSYREVLAIKKIGFTALGGAVGLYLFIKPSGQKYYVYRFKSIDGRRSCISLAPFSEMDLGTAREKALEWKQRLREGDNPSDVKREEAKAKRQQIREEFQKQQEASRTFSYVADLLMKERREGDFWAHNVVGEAHALRFLKNYINPRLGKIPIAELAVQDVFDMLISFYQRQPETAKKVVTLVSSIWKFAKAKEWASGENPADRKGTLGVLLEPYNKSKKKGENYPALPISDIPEFMFQLHQMNTMAARLVEFQILTACRSKMARTLKWTDINFEEKTATIREEALKTKGRGKHTVFLSREALAILKQIPQTEEYVFTNQSGKPFSDAAPGMVIKQMNRERAKDNLEPWLDHEQSTKKQEQIIITAQGTARASFKTWTKTGENRKLLDEEAVELCMAHNLIDDYDGAYNRTKLEDERRGIMQVWADYCHTNIPF